MISSHDYWYFRIEKRTHTKAVDRSIVGESFEHYSDWGNDLHGEWVSLREWIGARYDLQGFIHYTLQGLDRCTLEIFPVCQKNFNKKQFFMLSQINLVKDFAILLEKKSVVVSFFNLFCTIFKTDVFSGKFQDVEKIEMSKKTSVKHFLQKLLAKANLVNRYSEIFKKTKKSVAESTLP